MESIKKLTLYVLTPTNFLFFIIVFLSNIDSLVNFRILDKYNKKLYSDFGIIQLPIEYRFFYLNFMVFTIALNYVLVKSLINPKTTNIIIDKTVEIADEKSKVILNYL